MSSRCPGGLRAVGISGRHEADESRLAVDARVLSPGVRGWPLPNQERVSLPPAEHKSTQVGALSPGSKAGALGRGEVGKRVV